MIATVTGEVKTKLDTSIIVEVNGIGYKLNVSNKTLVNSGEIGSVVTFFTDLQIKDDKIMLYGFFEEKEINMFRTLQSIQGIGPKASLSILSALDVDEIILGISSADKTVFLKADGIGSKVATRIISELQDKINSFDLFNDIDNKSFNKITSESHVENIPDEYINDSISAIVNLGYTRSDAFKAVMNVKQELIRENENFNISIEKIIPIALKKLSG